MPNQSEPVVLDRHRLRMSAAVAVGVAAAVLIFGTATRLMAYNELKSSTSAQAIPTVKIVHAKPAEGGRDLTLPGRLEAWQQAPVYARTNGYLNKWYQDIGANVKAGQLLADIDAPELDQQVAQAQANLATAAANRQLALSTAERWRKLVGQDAVSRQEADEKEGDLAARTAMANAARADLDRLKALSNFKRLVAPFDGVVTSRATDVGALIVAGDGARPLFTVSDMRQMRIYIRVPQNYSADVRPGMTAILTVPEYPNRKFTAQLERSAEAVNDQSGTVLVQLVVDNPEHLLKSGAYGQLMFSLPAAPSTLRLPATTLIFRKDGMEVAVLGADGHVTFKPITIARDLGSEIEIGTGVSPSDAVIDSPPEALENGDIVRIFTPQGKADHDLG